MTDTDCGSTSIVGDLSKNLGTLFRHLLPGIFIVGAAYVAHPSWFAGINTQTWPHVAITAAIALAAGNIWFAFNRYGVHQVIDYLAYRKKSQGPVPVGAGCDYVDDLGKYVAKSLRSSTVPEIARQHVAFRASSVLLIYTVAEVAAIFAVWNEANTLFGRHWVVALLVSVAAFALGVWQNIITRRIDYYIVDEGK
jgi:hypothetical protein